jgi:hypothetical protein
MGAMTPLKRATASVLMGIRWLLLAVATLANYLADLAKDAAERLRR